MLLALLQETPMHAYRMQQLIKQRGKDKVVNVAQRNSVYQTIERLVRAELAEVMETSREPGRPERTVYRITATGSATLRSWLQRMLAVPAAEFPAFPAAVSTMMLLDVEDVIAQLEQRAERLRTEIATEDPAAFLATGALPRLFLLEDEYRVAMLRSELAWVESVLVELRSGAITWDDEWLRGIAAANE